MIIQLKSKKKIIILTIITVVFLFIIYSDLVFRTLNPINAFAIWKNVVPENNDIYEIKVGYYSGGSIDHSNVGYVFSSYDSSPAEVMDKIGFHDICHTYYDEKIKYQEYCTSKAGDYAIIKTRLFYIGGYLLKYEVVGEA